MGPCVIIYGVKRGKKIESKINMGKKRKQGSRDPDAPWSRARVLWMTQLMVQISLIDMQKEVNDPLKKKVGQGFSWPPSIGSNWLMG